MFEIVFSGLALFVAGTAKGIVGLGLPPIAMGLLVLVMSPVDAAATMVVPALLTNLWQALAGPTFWPLVRRFWLMLLLTACATAAFAGALTTHAGIATTVLGGLLVIYGLYGLRGSSVAVKPGVETWAAPVSGLATGIVTAMTGVSSMPSVPFLQSLGLSRDVFIQAIGISFSVSALALIAGLGMTGGFASASPAAIVLAVIGAFCGVVAGTQLRKRLDEQTFRRVVLWVLVALGAYLIFS